MSSTTGPMSKCNCRLIHNADLPGASLCSLTDGSTAVSLLASHCIADGRGRHRFDHRCGEGQGAEAGLSAARVPDQGPRHPVGSSSDP